MCTSCTSANLAISSATVLCETGTSDLDLYETDAKINAIGNTRAIASLLFTDWVLPFEIASILLLAAMVGAIVLSKKEL